ncbi:hypothetical protein [Pinibacter aurantiacus]|uniref:Uncharacterized protein n=1 Tax=Pinibacter aurantiacus TaxID=2851599 RepID=A0A9E2SF70_9BACT|nr:hypothetical protein [Pinibacter aurantiacus]MBV4360253.1 hypothetical protein [Pinibacter aurantiacus]
MEADNSEDLSKQQRTKSRIDYTSEITKILQGLAIVVGIAASIFEYSKWKSEQREQVQADIQRQKEQERVRVEQTAREFQKFFYQKQFDFYSEAIEATSVMATEQRNSAVFADARKKFYRLYWGRMTIVEDKNVEQKMMGIDRILRENESDNEEFSLKLKDASYNLAHAARQYIINVWVDSTDRKNYNN